MSTANDNKVRVDSGRLKKLLEEKGISMGAASVRLGYDRTLLNKLIRRGGCFEMKASSAIYLADLLACGIQDFKAEDEKGISPIIFDHGKGIEAKMQKMPAAQYSLANLCLNYIINADSQGLKALEDFLANPTQKAESITSADPTRWYQEYFMEKFAAELNKHLSERSVIPDEYELRDMVQRQWAKSCNEGKHNVKEARERIEKALRKSMIDAEDIISDTLVSVIKESSEFLLEFFHFGERSALTEVAAIKERL